MIKFKRQLKIDEDLWDELIAVIFPIAMAAMGGIMALYEPKPDDSYKWPVVLCFIFLGILASWSALKLQRTSRRKLAEMLTGGKNHPFITISSKDLANKLNPVPLWIAATGPIYDVSFWISPLSAKGNHRNDEYWSKGIPGYRNIIYKDPHLLGLSLPIGEYRIQFSARNGGFYQDLKMIESDGMLSFSTEIFNSNNEKLEELDSRLRGNDGGV